MHGFILKQVQVILMRVVQKEWGAGNITKKEKKKERKKKKDNFSSKAT